METRYFLMAYAAIGFSYAGWIYQELFLFVCGKHKDMDAEGHSILNSLVAAFAELQKLMPAWAVSLVAAIALLAIFSFEALIWPYSVVMQIFHRASKR